MSGATNHTRIQSSHPVAALERDGLDSRINEPDDLSGPSTLVRIMYIMLTNANTTEDLTGQPESPRAVPDSRKEPAVSPAAQAWESAVTGFQMLMCRVSGIRNIESTKATAGTTIG